MVAGSPLLRPRDADALRAELRRVAEQSGMPLIFGGEVHECGARRRDCGGAPIGDRTADLMIASGPTAEA